MAFRPSQFLAALQFRVVGILPCRGIPKLLVPQICVTRQGGIFPCGTIRKRTLKVLIRADKSRRPTCDTSSSRGCWPDQRTHLDQGSSRLAG